MRVFTVEELKKNLDKYIDLSAGKNVIVKDNGKIVAVLTSPSIRKKDVTSFLSLSEKYPGVDYQRMMENRERQR